MNLTFNKINDVFVSEFSVTSDFNLHIERSKGGSFTIFQRSSDGGNYGEVYYQEKLDKIKVIDYDFSALIYPKYIKIVSESEPTYAAITTDGEVTEIKAQSTMEYFLAQDAQQLKPYLSVVKLSIDSGATIQIIPYIPATADILESHEPLAFGVDFQARTIMAINEQKMEASLLDAIIGETGLSANQIAAIPRITEEEFYNLDNGGSSLIEFTINGATYQAEEGMTWGEFVESNYNDGSVEVNTKYGYIKRNTNYLSSPESGYIMEGDAIISGFNYQYLDE